ncbi:MAG TPA: hypothetical protein VFU20_08800 [Sphingomicrobium sp.]|nr:hypothetical protein [Sphingomicrobium sp.]
MADKKKEREERLAAALKENLKRRKAQAREMAQGVIPAEAGISGQEGAGD